MLTKPPPTRPAQRLAQSQQQFLIQPRRSLRKRLRSFLVGLLVVAVLVFAAFSLFLASLPDVGDAQARTAQILSEHKGTSADIPPGSNVARAIVAIEDRRFYQHPGVDPVSLVRAARDTITTGSPGGGAAIAQQLAKNLYIPDDEKLSTKLKEMGVGIKLEMGYPKDEVLNLYLNAIYYGEGQWGIEQASQHYFGKQPQDLDWAEASLIAGLPQAPSAYAPSTHFDLAKQRQRQVLDALVRDGILSASEADAAYAEPLGIGR